MKKEGSIYISTRKTSSGNKVKYYIFQYYDENGNRHSKSFPCTKEGKKEAERYQKQIMEDRDNGISTVPLQMTTGQWLIEYLELYRKPFIKPMTYKRYLEEAAHLESIFDIPLACLLPEQVQKLYNTILAKISQNAANKVIGLLMSAYKKAVETRLVAYNPVLPITRAKKENKEEIQILSYKQIRDISHTIDRMKKGIRSKNKKDPFGKHFNTYHDYKLLFWTLLTTGMRINELLALEWKDIDFDKKEIYVTKSKVNVPGNVVSSPKTQRGKREIPIISRRVFNKLKRLKETHGNFKYVFSTKNNTMVSYNNTHIRWKNVLNKAGISFTRNTCWHMLRHTFASFILRYKGEEIPPVSLSRILGHSDVSTTMRIYQHHISNDNEKILEALGKTKRNR